MDNRYNELEYAKEIKENGFQTRFIRREILVLVKYLKELGYSKKETTDFIYDFCEKNIEGFNEVRYYQTIDKTIMEGRKKSRGLIIIEDLPITYTELGVIDKLDVDKQYKKLMLSMLVKRKIAYEINKISNKHNDRDVRLTPYFNGTTRTFREAFKSANIDENGYKVNEMVSKLVSLEAVTSVVKGDIILEYVYDMYEFDTVISEVKNKVTHQVEDQVRRLIDYKIDESDVFFKLNDFENVGYVFEYYKENPKFKICDSCGILFKKRSNRQAYCKPCWAKREREQVRNRVKKHRLG